MKWVGIYYNITCFFQPTNVSFRDHRSPNVSLYDVFRFNNREIFDLNK